MGLSHKTTVASKRHACVLSGLHFVAAPVYATRPLRSHLTFLSVTSRFSSVPPLFKLIQCCIDCIDQPRIGGFSGRPPLFSLLHHRGNAPTQCTSLVNIAAVSPLGLLLTNGEAANKKMKPDWKQWLQKRDQMPRARRKLDRGGQLPILACESDLETKEGECARKGAKGFTLAGPGKGCRCKRMCMICESTSNDGGPWPQGSLASRHGRK